MAAEELAAGPAAAASRGLRARVRHVPLRIKLIAAVLALVAIALAVISTAGVVVYRHYLVMRADQQVHDLYQRTLALIDPRLVQPQIQPFGQYVVAIRPQGVQLRQSEAQPNPAQQPIPLPAVPVSPDWVQEHSGQTVTVGSLSGGDNWRVIVSPIRYQTRFSGVLTGTLIVAVDLGDVKGSIGLLTTIDLVVGVIVLAALAAAGVAIVRASLRPITDIEQTAERIAAGDLTQRVPDEDPATEVGRLGRSLNAMLAQIEQAFRARTASEQAARRSEEKMRQFIADASHELRTPLTTIRGYAEHYRQRGGMTAVAPQAGQGVSPGPDGVPSGRPGQLAPDEVDGLLRRVEDEAARMGTLVDDLLLLARLDQQRPLDKQTVDLLALAADAAHDARLIAPDRSVAVTVGSGAALLVPGDEARLRQVIGNLMSNALKHTPAGSPIELLVRPGTLRTGQAAAVLEVADRGPGLTPEQARRAFERFYRADKARTSAGTGLGLSIVAALVTAHGGQVWADSRPAGGAVFAIALPLAPEAIAATAEDDPEDAGSARDAGALGPAEAQQAADEARSRSHRTGPTPAPSAGQHGPGG